MWRRATAALALCGLLAYSGLFPGHIVSQLVADLGEYGVVSAVNGCHDEGGATKPQPTNGAKKHCPFCTGYASFQFAAAAWHTFLLPPQAIGGDALAVEDHMALRKSATTPQNRGPPSLSV